MTDKQIIIDGVDVSGCRYLFDDTLYKRSKTSCSITLKDCKYLGNNCYYKQLKRKECEYEDLRQYHNKCCKENAEKLEQWLENFNQVSKDFYNGKYCNKENCSLLKAKEQECEELKSTNKIYEQGIARLKDEKNNLKKENKKLKKEIEDWQEEVLRIQSIGSYGIMDEVKKNTRYCKILAEIRDIATCCIEGDVARIRMKQILQKINEVIDV